MSFKHSSWVFDVVGVRAPLGLALHICVYKGNPKTLESLGRVVETLSFKCVSIVSFWCFMCVFLLTEF